MEREKILPASQMPQGAVAINRQSVSDKLRAYLKKPFSLGALVLVLLAAAITVGAVLWVLVYTLVQMCIRDRGSFSACPCTNFCTRWAGRRSTVRCAACGWDSIAVRARPTARVPHPCSWGNTSLARFFPGFCWGSCPRRFRWR